MIRTKGADLRIDKATVRASLPIRREPFWSQPLAPGLYLGFRRTQASGTWISRAFTDDKRHRYKSIGPVSPELDYEAARRAALAWHRQLAAGVDQSGTVTTVAEAGADYVQALRRAKRATTADDAARRFERMLNNDPIGRVKLEQLRQRHLEQWRERMESGNMKPLPAKRGRPPTVKPMTPSAFKRNLSVLKAALNHAVARRYLAAERSIEWDSIKPEKGADGKRDLYLTRDQRRALLASAVGDVRDLIECAALTGCRAGDPAAMTRRDYDQRTGSVTFRTKDHLRTIEVSPGARELFDRLAEGKDPDDLMFTNGGKGWTPADWADGVRAAADAAGLPKETVLYTLRHCYITDAIVSGMDLLTVARLVGTSILMIQKTYGHLVPGAARERMAALDL